MPNEVSLKHLIDVGVTGKKPTMKNTLTTLLLFSSLAIFSQSQKAGIKSALDKFDFIQQQIIAANDTIIYYLRNYETKPTKLVLFIQGTDANPIFSYEVKDGKTVYYRWFGDDYKQLDDSYTFAIIPKPGMDGLFPNGEVEIPQAYYEGNHLGFRSKQIDRSINHIVENHMASPEKVIVYGHSEGAAIAAAVATTNSNISHLGFWSGNVLNNFYEFSLFNRIEALEKKISDEEAHQNVMGILEWYKSVTADPNSTQLDHFGFTNKRWSSYEKAPIDYLAALDIPIYALFGSEDVSTPIETAYLLPVKFIEKRKENLSFNVCIGCDHTYQMETEEGTASKWLEQFKAFIEWTEATD